VVQDKDEKDIRGGIKLGESRRIVNRLGLRYKQTRARYDTNSESNLGLSLPEDYKTETYFVTWQTLQNKFITMRRIDKMTRVEDFNLGSDFNLSPGVSPAFLDEEEKKSYLETSWEKYSRWKGSHVLFTHLEYSGRDIFKSARNELATFQGKYYYQGLPSQTLVFNTEYQHGHDLDPDNQVEIGSDHGLRAYEPQQMVGEKSLLFNVEDRLYFIEELWHLFSVGGVAFFDSGYAWSKNQPVKLSDLLNTVGVGLRIGLTHSSQETILRFDFCYRLNPPPDDLGKVVFSFGTNQAF
jgi:hypothetical protein